MKKIVAFMAIGAMLMSCSNDDDQKEEFFNLAEGNFWVYKRYNASPENTVGVYANRIDTVRVEGNQLINGLNYYRLTHSHNSDGEGKDEFVRVDASGHLVNSEGLVLHPGKDKQYEYTRIINGDVGKVKYKLGDVVGITVENKNYRVYPYVGDFVPTSAGLIGGVGSFESYQEGLGFVVKHCRYLSSTSYYEDRLVYHNVK